MLVAKVAPTEGDVYRPRSCARRQWVAWLQPLEVNVYRSTDRVLVAKGPLLMWMSIDLVVCSSPGEALLPWPPLCGCLTVSSAVCCPQGRAPDADVYRRRRVFVARCSGSWLQCTAPAQCLSTVGDGSGPYSDHSATCGWWSHQASLRGVGCAVITGSASNPVSVLPWWGLSWPLAYPITAG